MELIITEKDNAARRIAEILSEGSASTERRNGVNVYRWGDKRVVGLSGHVVGVDFPPEYSDWRDVEPKELIYADVTKEPTQENIVTTLQQLARRADEAVIATDYDREGELIGKEAYELIRAETDIPISRVRFSSITDREVTEAFADPDDVDFDLAAAGEARQIIDLVWGAALTRFLSLSARQLGNDFISVGRVQSPTLKLIVDREREIQAFEPEAYWELFADLAKNGSSFEAQYFYDDDGTEAERVWDESEADAAFADLTSVDAATVTSVRRRTREDSPPTPFKTTAFISAASSLGYSAQRAMSIAEDLYTAGYITYPRTDNTVYPEDLEEDALLDAFVGSPTFGEDAESLLEQDELVATEGDEETTDHPPIHPTGELPARSELSDAEWEIFELVVRRFRHGRGGRHLGAPARRRRRRRPLAEGQRQAPGRARLPRRLPLLQCQREPRPRRRGGRGTGHHRSQTGGQGDPATPQIRPVAAHRDHGGAWGRNEVDETQYYREIVR